MIVFWRNKVIRNNKFSNRRPVDKGPQVLTERIRAEEVRLIDGETNEVVSREEAERLAEERDLDLVVMSLDSEPIVVRLIDYGKFKFEADKKAKEAKKKQHTVDTKEIKMGIRIDDHDYNVKMNHTKKFLSQGNKVKVTIRLKGREMQHKDLAFDLANRFIVDLEGIADQEGSTRLEGRTININLAPSKDIEKTLAGADSGSDETEETTLETVSDDVSDEEE